MRSHRQILALGVALVLLGFALPAQADLLYFVDFGTPPHTEGSPPVTGSGPAPRATPTSINFGDPTVRAAFEDMNSQPCVFGNGTTGYDQIQFGVGTNDPQGFPDDYDDYYLSVDVVIGIFLNDVFVILFDAPTVNRLDFLSNGDIQEVASGSIIGAWTPGTTVRVAIHFDSVNEIWEISLDGTPAYSGPVATDGRLRAIRLHQSGGDVANGAAADNFVLTSDSPASVEDGGNASTAGLGWTLPPHPNPASDGVTIRWATTAPASVRVEITDLSGRRVWVRKVTGDRVGLNSIRWGGQDLEGRALPSSIYFIRIIAGSRLLGGEKIVLRR